MPIGHQEGFQVLLHGKGHRIFDVGITGDDGNRCRDLPDQPLDLTLPPLEVEAGRVEQVTLRGYDLTPATMRAGESFTVTLYWQAVTPLTIDYTSYVHLIDSQGNGLSQHDHQPGGDFYPSHYWQPDEILRDQHTLPIPAGTPPGLYQLRAGLYDQPEPGQIRGMGAGEIIGSLEIER